MAVKKFSGRGSGRRSGGTAQWPGQGQPFQTPSGGATSHPRSRGKRIATLRCHPWRNPKTGKPVMMILDTGTYDKSVTKDFVETLKKSIKPKLRTWENTENVWIIQYAAYDILTHILSEFYDDVLLEDFPAPEISDSSWGTLYLVKEAPIEVVKAAYRALAKKYHSDAGGDDEAMARINVAYKEILSGKGEKDE